MILFLDFDGVLHHFSQDIVDEFSRLPRLVALLREPKFAHVQIVISSSWRTRRLVHRREVIMQMRPLEEMREYFPSDLRQRIIGLTPYLGGLLTNGVRQREIEAWLQANNHEKSPWLALDDIDNLFDADCQNLVIVSGIGGLDDSDELRLRNRLKSRQGKNHD